jgi:hypothetical protein
MEQPRQESIDKMWKYAERFAEKSGTSIHPEREITEAVVLGLASNIGRYGRPARRRAAGWGYCWSHLMPSPNHDLDALLAFFQAKYGEAFTQWLWDEGAPLVEWLRAHPGATDADVTQALFDRLPTALRTAVLAHLRAYQQKAPES